MKITRGHLKQIIREELEKEGVLGNIGKKIKGFFGGGKKKPTQNKQQPAASQEPQETGPSFRDLMAKALSAAASAYNDTSNDKTYHDADAAAAMGILKTSGWDEVKFNYSEAKEVIANSTYGRPFSSDAFNKSRSEAANYLTAVGANNLSRRLSSASSEYDSDYRSAQDNAWKDRWD